MLLSCFIFSCGDGDDPQIDPPIDPLIGTWRQSYSSINNVEKELTSCQDVYEYEYKEDGTYKNLIFVPFLNDEDCFSNDTVESYGFWHRTKDHHYSITNTGGEALVYELIFDGNNKFTKNREFVYSGEFFVSEDKFYRID